MLLKWDRGTVGTFRRVHCKPSTERSDIQAISRNREPSRNWRRNLPLPLLLLLLLLLLFPERQHFQFQFRFQFQREVPIPMRATRNESRRRTMTKTKRKTTTKTQTKTKTKTKKTMTRTHTHAHTHRGAHKKRAHCHSFWDWYYTQRGVCNPGTTNWLTNRTWEDSECSRSWSCCLVKYAKVNVVKRGQLLA